MSGRSNGERFEAAYNRIDAYLRKMTGLGRGEPFQRVVSAAGDQDARVARFAADLKEFAELRNAIVHDRGRRPTIIADPRDEAVALIERIEKTLEDPVTLRTYPSPRPIAIFGLERPLSAALGHMKDNDYSQVVIRSADTYGIVSHEGIARWLEHKVGDDIISLKDAALADVAGFEPSYTCRFASARSPVEEAMRMFERATERLYCVIATENGRANETPLNLLTAWDIAKYP